MSGVAAGELATLRRLRAQRRAAPEDPGPALAEARLSLRLARLRQDERLLRGAEATLEAWARPGAAVPGVWTLRARARQARHDFAGALEDLERALAEDPRDAAAWLLMGSVHLVRGEYALARGCGLRLLAQGRGGLAARALVAAVGSLEGRAPAALASLEAALAEAGAEDPAPTRAYAEGLAGEIAARLDRAPQARAHLEAAAALSPQDPGPEAELADWLLARGDARAVLARIPPDEPRLSLELRRARAERALGDPAFAARLPRLRVGVGSHPREAAMLRLHLLDDPEGALQDALGNWEQQREPADARLLAECARAAGRPEAAAPVRAWRHRHGVEDAALARLLEPGELSPGSSRPSPRSAARPPSRPPSPPAGP